MKNKLYLALMTSLAFLLSGCEAIGDIFEAGFNVGVFVVLAVIVIIVFIFLRLKK